jgi:two-component sensor histidine kinase/ActR/RegA family two-component response regulator
MFNALRLKVLIAEDDLFMADLLEDVLVEGGYEVCGIARTVDDAVQLCEHHKPHLAILDLRLANGENGGDIVNRLPPENRPGILYATGNQAHATAENVKGEACLGKPYRSADVIRALEIVEQLVTTGEASGPFPGGFRLLRKQPTTAIGPISGDVKSINTITRLRRQQAALAAFGGFALYENDLDKVLTEAARVCAEGLDVPFSKICRYRPEENDLLVEAGVGWHDGVIGCVVSRADESSPQGRAFITQQPVICVDLSKDVTFVLPSFYADHGIVSTLDVIIKKKEGQPYGVLEIDSPSQHDYDDHDIDFLTGFANVLAEAVATAKRNTALQNAMDRMREVVADRDRLVTAKSLALNEKNRLLADKDILAAELQHRVRNNLQLVYGMLTRELQSNSDGRGTEGLSAIARRVMTLAQVYDHLLGTGLSRTIDFGGYLSSLCSSFAALQDARQRNIRLTCHSKPVILDLDCVTALGLVIAELISNSYAHAFPNGTGTISVWLVPSESGSEAIITFRDDGVGFAESGNSRRHGLGLVKRLMEQVGGSAELCSDQGTKWTLKFPMLVVPTSERGEASETV